MRRRNVMMLHRRWCDLVKTSCAHWEIVLHFSNTNTLTGITRIMTSSSDCGSRLIGGSVIVLTAISTSNTYSWMMSIGTTLRRQFALLIDLRYRPRSGGTGIWKARVWYRSPDSGSTPVRAHMWHLCFISCTASFSIYRSYLPTSGMYTSCLS